MTFYYKILMGLLIGLAIGGINFYLMRVFVRLAMKNSGRARGVFIIIMSYALRYLLIGAVIFALVKTNEQTMALIVLAVLATLTILLAIWQQNQARRRAGEKTVAGG